MGKPRRDGGTRRGLNPDCPPPGPPHTPRQGISLPGRPLGRWAQAPRTAASRPDPGPLGPRTAADPRTAGPRTAGPRRRIPDCRAAELRPAGPPGCWTAGPRGTGRPHPGPPARAAGPRPAGLSEFGTLARGAPDGRTSGPPGRAGGPRPGPPGCRAAGRLDPVSRGRWTAETSDPEPGGTGDASSPNPSDSGVVRPHRLRAARSPSPPIPELPIPGSRAPRPLICGLPARRDFGSPGR